METSELGGLQVRALLDEDRACPFQQWYNALRDRTARSRIIIRLLRMEQGNFGDHRERISGTISELRLDYGPGYRIYYVRHGKSLIVLLGGGTKEGQQRDIEACTALWERNKADVERLSRDYRSGLV